MTTPYPATTTTSLLYRLIVVGGTEPMSRIAKAFPDGRDAIDKLIDDGTVRRVDDHLELVGSWRWERAILLAILESGTNGYSLDALIRSTAAAGVPLETLVEPMKRLFDCGILVGVPTGEIALLAPAVVDVPLPTQRTRSELPIIDAEPRPASELTTAERALLLRCARVPGGAFLQQSDMDKPEYKALINRGVLIRTDERRHRYVHPDDAAMPADQLDAVEAATRELLVHLERHGASSLTGLDLDPQLVDTATYRLDGVLIRRHNGRWTLIDGHRPTTDAGRAERTATRRAAKPAPPTEALKSPPPPPPALPERWMTAVLDSLTRVEQALTGASPSAPITPQAMARKVLVCVVAAGKPLGRGDLRHFWLSPKQRRHLESGLAFALERGALDEVHPIRGPKYRAVDPSAIGLTWEQVHAEAAKLRNRRAAA